MMELSVFYDKLNKVDGKVYVIEEEIRMPDNGIYEAELQHDNIVDSTLAVYTDPTLTGEQLQTYALSTPSLMPWKELSGSRRIKRWSMYPMRRTAIPWKLRI